MHSNHCSSQAHLAYSDYEGVVQLWDVNANSEVRALSSLFSPDAVLHAHASVPCASKNIFQGWEVSTQSCASLSVPHPACTGSSPRTPVKLFHQLYRFFVSKQFLCECSTFHRWCSLRSTSACRAWTTTASSFFISKQFLCCMCSTFHPQVVQFEEHQRM
mgnify:CR=1 FL=1